MAKKCNDCEEDYGLHLLHVGTKACPYDIFHCCYCGHTEKEITQDHPDWSDTVHMNPELADALYDEMKGN